MVENTAIRPKVWTKEYDAFGTFEDVNKISEFIPTTFCENAGEDSGPKVEGSTCWTLKGYYETSTVESGDSTLTVSLNLQSSVVVQVPGSEAAGNKEFVLYPNDLTEEELAEYSDPEPGYVLPMDHTLKVFWAIANQSTET